MTLESGSWQSHNSQIPQQTNTIETAHAEEIKREHLIGELFDRVLDLVDGPHGLPQHTLDIDDYELINGPKNGPAMHGVPMPTKHLRGYVREAYFKHQGLWVRTTAPGLPHTVHNLFLYTDGRPHEYHVTDLTADAEHEPRSLVGVEQMGASALVLGNLERLEATLEMESIAHGHVQWPHQLSDNDLKFARKPRTAA